MSVPRAAEQIQLVVSDVDGTLVDPDKQLTPATIEAVQRLGEAGISFAVTSGRPPRGMEMLVEPLGLSTPIGAFNGGQFVDADMNDIRSLDLDADLVEPIIGSMRSHGLFVWVYSGTAWYVTDARGPHVVREATTVRFDPEVVDSLAGLGPITKIVGVSDDHDAVAAAEADARERFCHSVSAARSQPYYLDVTHPDANKGAVVTYLAGELGIALSSVATLGDSANDVLMFARCGVSIAMGNADPEVQRAARYVTRSNDDDGFAHAIERFVLGGS